jgi:hypothetical protein
MIVSHGDYQPKGVLFRTKNKSVRDLWDRDTFLADAAAPVFPGVVDARTGARNDAEQSRQDR